MTPSAPMPKLRSQISAHRSGESGMASLSRLSMRTKSLPRPWYLKNSQEGIGEACPRGTLDLGPDDEDLATIEARRVVVVAGAVRR